jgi:Mn2+/Fe2+ NRAMP family transporter
LLWVLLLSTVALIAFRGPGGRMRVVTGQGLMGLIRDRYGPRYGGAALVLLVLANLGTTCAELAGVAAGFELFGISRYLAVPIVTVGVSVLVLGGPVPSHRAPSDGPGGCSWPISPQVS